MHQLPDEWQCGSSLDPAQFAILSHRLSELRVRKATIAVRQLMTEQSEARQDEEIERLANVDDDYLDLDVDTETF